MVCGCYTTVNTVSETDVHIGSFLLKIEELLVSTPTPSPCISSEMMTYKVVNLFALQSIPFNLFYGTGTIIISQRINV